MLLLINDMQIDFRLFVRLTYSFSSIHLCVTDRIIYSDNCHEKSVLVSNFCLLYSMASHTYASFDHNHYIKQTFFFLFKNCPFCPSRERKRGREMKSSHLWQRTHLFHLSRYRTSDTPSYSPPRSPLASNLSIALASPRLLSGLISSFARRPLLLLRLFCLVLCFIFWDVLVFFLLSFVICIPFWSY